MNRIKNYIWIFLIVATQQLWGQSLTFETLTCNSQQNPIAIQSLQPTLSWVVKANGFNRSQTAFHLLVASHPDLLNKKNADMWNSGKVQSSQSSHVKYHGKPLQAGQKYWWKVRIWDEKGKASDWSPVNSFETGLFKDENWEGSKWMSLNEDTRTSEYRFRDYKTGRMNKAVKVTSQPVGYFRKEWITDKEIESARAYICGLGYYELYVNGEKTGDHVLDPAPSNYDRQAYYVTYDITSQLIHGGNAIGIILGNGFYGQTISWKNDPESERDLSYGVPAARLLVKVNYKDGSQNTFFSDESWKASTGPIVFDNLYGGDTYDARFEIPGWNTFGFDDEKWQKAKIISPKVNKISAQEMPPIRRLKELKPQRIFKSPEGNWIVDFGQNIAGWIQITVNEEEGKVIELIPTEALTQDGKNIYPGSTGGGANGMPQLLQYICKGNGSETWEPKFSYHGFRYAEISGMTNKPDVNLIKAVLVATDVERKGSFSCSDPLFNKMDTISRWTIEDNLHGIPEDCPHREKCGWLGDAHAFCEYALYNYEMLSFYKKYMEDIRTQMRPVNGDNNSNEKYSVPTMIAPGKRTSSIAKLDWGVATMYLPWYNYLYYGDSSIVTEYYDEMKELTNYYLTFKNEDGIIDNGMGDWCPPRWDRRQNPEAMECDPVISANAYFYDILGIMQVFAEMTQDDAFKSKMREEEKALKKAFNKQFLQEIPLVGYPWYGSQTATVMALQFGMVPDESIKSVVDGLAYDILAVKGRHHSTGIHGNRYIYTVLSRYGKANLAHDILTTPTFPSQTYVMNYGFTTWPERQFFWEEMKGLSNSLNHPMHSGFAAYFYEAIGGIKSSYHQPGYRVFNVDPTFPTGVNHANVEIPTPYGTIRNSWKMENSTLTLHLTVPFNTKANLILSDSELLSLIVNGEVWENKKDPKSAAILGSGVYKITYHKDQD